MFGQDGLSLRNQFVLTLAVAAVLMVLRWAVGRALRSGFRQRPESGRRWIVRMRFATLALGSIAFVVIWSAQLKDAALSLVAFAVALVFAGSELLKALSASVIRANSRAFKIGDRIRVGEIRGEVIDHTLMSTTLLEVSPAHVRTGRSISIPNGLFLTEPVVNETRGHRFLLHSFHIQVPVDRWREAHDVVMEAAVASSSPYLEQARRRMNARAREYSLAAPVVDPFVAAKPMGSGLVDLIVRLPVTSSDTWKVEQEVTSAWLDRIG